MRLSVFSKLFLVHVFFTILPAILIITAVFLNYENEITNLWEREDRFLFSDIFQFIYLSLMNLKIQIILVILTIIFLGFIGNIVFTKIILNPLSKLRQGVKELGQDDSSFKINIKPGDEFGDLAGYFNKAAFSIRESRESLQKTKDFFEKQATLRTKELKNLIDQRESVIKQRTGELQERIQELETIHRLAANREIKMIELKEEILQLRKKLEKYTNKK